MRGSRSPHQLRFLGALLLGEAPPRCEEPAPSGSGHLALAFAQRCNIYNNIYNNSLEKYVIDGSKKGFIYWGWGKHHHVRWSLRLLAQVIWRLLSQVTICILPYCICIWNYVLLFIFVLVFVFVFVLYLLVLDCSGSGHPLHASDATPNLRLWDLYFDLDFLLIQLLVVWAFCVNSI